MATHGYLSDNQMPMVTLSPHASVIGASMCLVRKPPTVGPLTFQVARSLWIDKAQTHDNLWGSLFFSTEETEEFINALSIQHSLISLGMPFASDESTCDA